jgi:hypothetical protein
MSWNLFKVKICLPSVCALMILKLFHSFLLCYARLNFQFTCMKLLSNSEEKNYHCNIRLLIC